jgi:hypothetical protein
LQAEAENLKIENEMLYTWKHKHEKELDTATALAEKYRGQRDELIKRIEIMLENYGDTGIIPVYETMKYIESIQEADK